MATLLLVLASLAVGASAIVGPAPNTTRYFAGQKLDHFNPQSSATWRQRYFVNETFFQPSKQLVFLCVGGEGPPLEPTVVVTGDFHCALMVTLAAKHGALIVALEHRFYGESIPTPDFSTPNLRFLSSRQALADIAVFHQYINDKYRLSSPTWLTFGGSYPGMLAAWARYKYPHLIHAAVSSSAPVHAEVRFTAYNDVVAASLAQPSVGGSAACLKTVQAAFQDLGETAHTPSGQRALEQSFHVCGTDALADRDAQRVFQEALWNSFPAQSNDPACTSPGCNIEKLCAQYMLNASLGTPLDRLAALVNVTQGPACIDASYAKYKASITNTTVAGGTNRIWLYQTCAEFGFYQTCEPNTECPFTAEQGLVDLDWLLSDCATAFGISPDQVSANVAWSNAFYGSDHPDGSRILFVNGDIDPWHALSILAPLPNLPAFVVPGASHHAWTHPARPTDSPALVDARKHIAAVVESWLPSP